MKKILLLVLFSFVMISCGSSPRSQFDGDTDYRDRLEPEGDTDHLEESVEEITDDPDGFVASIARSLENVWNAAKDCESSTPNIPLSEADFVFTIIGRTSPIATGRECIIQRLEEASSRLCDGQRSIYDAFQAYSRGYDERSDRIRSAYENTLIMEDNFRTRLLDFSDTYYDRADRASNGLIESEYRALAIVFEQEGEFECRDRLTNYERMRRSSRR